ncbi:MAG: gamma-glutamyltransferase [Bacteroidetes bacterium]|nr:gamma-glutamyltransferase [Bacteroidota bacterium]MBU1679825.1 gamma-glutamyltransferase [Bacteroidota bacterium]MBU2507925.1 gamma-glutamyltransferase [Bacteroidota bacterium]
MLMRIFSKIVFICLLSATLLLSASKDPARAKNGMVVSASSIASEVGVAIMKKGGNAIDAAVAVGFALAVTHPSAGNLGGGGFMVIHLKDGKNTTIDYREKAPSATHKDIYLNSSGEFDPKLSTEGWTSSGVPGSVAGLLYALEKYGTLPLRDVIQPTIDLAQNGFEISYRMAISFAAVHSEFVKYASSKKVFTKDGGKYEEGDALIQRDLALTLKLIRDRGRDGFYSGRVADLIVQQSKKNGGYLTHKDLENYSPVERVPINGSYRGYDIISMGPPSSGGVAIVQTLNALENFTFEKNDWGSSYYIHTVSEILKHTYADRSKYLGDEDFYPVPKGWLTSKEYGREIASTIKSTAIPSKEISPGIMNSNESTETTHYSIVDSYGNAVSATTTINSNYGNKIVVDGAGFIMNNEMDDFSAKPGTPNQFGLLGGEANSIQSGKRMLSAMTPTILLKDDKPFLVIGSPGGSTIITVVLQVIINVVDFKMDIQEAIDQPRFHHQWFPERIDFERFCISRDVRDILIEKGQLMGTEVVLGRAEGIIINENGIKLGATDPRGFGGAAGY